MRDMPKVSETAVICLDDLPFLIVSLTHSFRALADRTLEDAGLDRSLRPGMGAIFYALCLEDGCNVKHLVDTLHIPNGTLTGLLNAMESQKIIERRDCPDDGRAFRIHLTARARKLIPAMLSRHEKVVKTLTAGFSRAEVESLTLLLRRVLANTEPPVLSASPAKAKQPGSRRRVAGGASAVSPVKVRAKA